MVKFAKAIWEGEFTVFGVRLRCYVLDSGQRIINAEDVEHLFEMMASPDCPALDQAEVAALAKWQAGRSTQRSQ